MTTASRSTRLNTACAKAGGLRSGFYDKVGFYDKPLAKFERLIETYVTFAPERFRSWLTALPLGSNPRDAYQGRYVFTDHHESYALGQCNK